MSLKIKSPYRRPSRLLRTFQGACNVGTLKAISPVAARVYTALTIMPNSGQVIIEHDGKQYGATYAVSHGMLRLKTHTETRSIELGNEDPETVARRTLHEIVGAQGGA